MKTKKTKFSLGMIFLLFLMSSLTVNSANLLEEEGKRYQKFQIIKESKKGICLVLKYQKEKASFIGSIENKTEKELTRARVEIHLSNGKELGPSTPVNLKAGQKKEIELKAKNQEFQWWSAHVEVGNSEHGHDEKGESHEEGEHRGSEHR